MNDGEDNTLIEAHRYARQAEEAVKKGHWQQAIDKHSRAAQNFQACVGLTCHPAGDKVLAQLALFHLESAERVRSRLQPLPSRPVHFTHTQAPLIIRLPASASTSNFAGQEDSIELSDSVTQPEPEVRGIDKPPVETKLLTPTIINIQISQNFHPTMSATAQACVQQIESLLSQLSFACKSDSTDSISKDTVNLFVTEMHKQVARLHESVSLSVPVGPSSVSSSSALDSSIATQRQLEEQVASLERQLAAETSLRQQQQKKLENAEIVIEKHKKRWKLLKEAAIKKDGDAKDSQ